MSDEDEKNELMNFPDQEAFGPILRAPADDYRSESEKMMLAGIKRTTESEKDRLHKSYASAEEVRFRFPDDLNSKTAKKKDLELDTPDLPMLPDLKPEFLKLCERLGMP